MNIRKDQIRNINTYDKVATDIFGVDKQFGFRFNWNFREFWAQAGTFYNLKTVGDLPLNEAKVFTIIHLN